MTGGYDPTSTPADALLIRVQETVYRRSRIDPIVLPRNAGSWPGYVFTGDPLRLPAGHFGLGHGDRKSTRLNSSHSQISYAVFCLKKKKNNMKKQNKPHQHSP